MTLATEIATGVVVLIVVALATTILVNCGLLFSLALTLRTNRRIAKAQEAGLDVEVVHVEVRLCDRHKAMLTEHLTEAGLGNLVPEDVEIGQSQLEDMLKRGEVTATNYNPVVSATQALIHHTIEQSHGALTMVPDDAEHDSTIERCPVCFMQEHHDKHCHDADCPMEQAGGYDAWISVAADEQREFAEQMGFLEGGA